MIFVRWYNQIMNLIFEKRKSRDYTLGKNELTQELLEIGYQWIVVQGLTHEVYSDQISLTHRISQARDFLLNRFSTPKFAKLKLIQDVKRGRDKRMYLLPKGVIAGFILRYGIDVVRALYNAKEIDVAKE